MLFFSELFSRIFFFLWSHFLRLVNDSFQIKIQFYGYARALIKETLSFFYFDSNTTDFTENLMYIFEAGDTIYSQPPEILFFPPGKNVAVVYEGNVSRNSIFYFNYTLVPNNSNLSLYDYGTEQ